MNSEVGWLWLQLPGLIETIDFARVHVRTFHQHDRNRIAGGGAKAGGV